MTLINTQRSWISRMREGTCGLNNLKRKTRGERNNMTTGEKKICYHRKNQ